MKVTIIKTGINGEGIGYIDRVPVFVPGVLVGELVDITVVEKQKRFMHAKVNRILKKSPLRVQPKCKIQHKCGGCPMMIATYEGQLQAKRDLLKQSLIKYAHVNPRLIQKIIPCTKTLSYRNQCKLPCAMVDGRLTTGMYLPNSNYFCEIYHCQIHTPGLEEMRKQVLEVLNRYHYMAYDYHQKQGIRSLIIRGFQNRYQLCIVSGEHPLLQDCVDEIMRIPHLVSLWQSYHTIKKTQEMFGNKMIHLGGERLLEFSFDSLTLRISPRSFFQLHSEQAIRLYQTIASMVPQHNDLIVEAYSGIGAISLFVKDKAKEVIGIESIKDAVVNANENAKLNGVEHVSFLCADAADKLTYLSKKRSIDTLIVDPPRSGLSEEMLYCILKSKIKHIVYVSCNPATLGKNLFYLQEKYQVVKVQPIDMFPNTPLVETVVMLSYKK